MEIHSMFIITVFYCTDTLMLNSYSSIDQKKKAVAYPPSVILPGLSYSDLGPSPEVFPAGPGGNIRE